MSIRHINYKSNNDHIMTIIKTSSYYLINIPVSLVQMFRFKSILALYIICISLEYYSKNC